MPVLVPLITVLIILIEKRFRLLRIPISLTFRQFFVVLDLLAAIVSCIVCVESIAISRELTGP